MVWCCITLFILGFLPLSNASKSSGISWTIFGILWLSDTKDIVLLKQPWSLQTQPQTSFKKLDCPYKYLQPSHPLIYRSVSSAAWKQVANIPANDPVAKGLHAFHTGLSAMAMAAVLLSGLEDVSKTGTWTHMAVGHVGTYSEHLRNLLFLFQSAKANFDLI